MTPGARSKFGSPMFEPEVFRKQMYCIEEFVTLLGLFGAPAVIRRPHIDSAHGELCPSCPVVTPWLQRAATRLNKP